MPPDNFGVIAERMVDGVFIRDIYVGVGAVSEADARAAAALVTGPPTLTTYVALVHPLSTVLRYTA